MPYGAEMARAEVGGVEKSVLCGCGQIVLILNEWSFKKAKVTKKVNGSPEAGMAVAKVKGAEREAVEVCHKAVDEFS